jgi:hypothetical protein
MQPSVDECDTDVVLHALGSSMKRSLENTITQQLPAEIGLLLLRLALVEVLKNAAEEEARETSPESFSEEMIRALQQSIGFGFASIIG